MWKPQLLTKLIKRPRIYKNVLWQRKGYCLPEHLRTMFSPKNDTLAKWIKREAIAEMIGDSPWDKRNARKRHLAGESSCQADQRGPLCSSLSEDVPSSIPQNWSKYCQTIPNWPALWSSHNLQESLQESFFFTHFSHATHEGASWIRGMPASRLWRDGQSQDLQGCTLRPYHMVWKSITTWHINPPESSRMAQKCMLMAQM